jgi:Cu-processing system permease protein
MSGARIVAGYALQECLRRRVFAVVLILTALFLALYAWGAWAVFRSTEQFSEAENPLEAEVIAGSTILGLAMFAILFLGAVLAVFLTLGAVRGDAERGLLQPLVVRPLGRSQLLLGRFLASAGVCAAYVVGVYLVAVLITGAAGGWWPDRLLLPGLGLTAGVVVISAVALLGSVYLSATANGIAVFMVFGAGLVAGLLGQIGEALSSNGLETAAETAAWLLPFEALYQAGLAGLTADSGGLTDFAVQLGPFGGAEESSPLLWVWAVAYVLLIGAAARAGFARRDL